jgi:2-methylcitrate dehydratase PrpD
MMARVAGVFDQKIDAMGYDKIRSVVEVDLTDGRTVVQPSDDRYRGGPDRPFTREELHAKFVDCAQLALPADRIQRGLTQIASVDSLKNITELVKTLV